MPDSHNPALGAKSRASYVLSIAIALTFFKGIELLIQGASMSLETVSVRLINMLLVRSWRNVLLLDEPRYQLAMWASSIFIGLLLITAALAFGNKLLSRARFRD
jgi:hypothetical protein